MANRELGIVINRNGNYTNYTFDPFTFTVFLALAPFIYIIPTFIIIYRIFRIFIRNVLRKKDSSVNRSVFKVLVLSHISSLGFFLSDLFVIRIPSTGIMTSWCYNQEPNHFLSFIFNAQAYFNLCVMLYPVLFSVIRLVITYFPNRHEEINSKILKFVVPIIQLYPLPLLIFTIPALGVCRQHFAPYSFGAVYIHFINSWKGIMNAPITVVNSAIWLSTCLILNWVLYQKIRKLRIVTNMSQPHQSVRNNIIEVSLSFTTLAMLFSYATNLVFLGAFMIDYEVATYLVVFRPFGFDLELCVVPWVFYLTHPAFKKRTDTRVVVNSTRKPGQST